MIEGGFYLKARCIQNSDIATAPPHIREIWDWLLKEANHTDKKWGNRTIKRGQLFRTYDDIREGLSWMVGYRKMTYNENHTKRAMKFLREHRMIDTTKELGGVLITIVNYDKYQNVKNYERTEEQTSESTNAEPMTNHPLPHINKNEKELKNENKTTIATTVAGSTGDGVNEIFQVFYETVNPTIKFGNTTQRKAAQNLIDHFGLPAVLEAAKYAVLLHDSGDQYAPRISTPRDLEEKYPALRKYYKDHQTKSSQSKVLEV